MSYDVDRVKQAAAGQWMTIITALCDIQDELLDGNHHGCPACGGKDRFRAFNDFETTGGVICNQCEAKADGIEVVAWLNDIEFVTALGEVAKFLRLKPEKNSRASRRKPSTKRQRPPSNRKQGASSKKSKPLLKLKSWNPQAVSCFLRRCPQWSEEILQACGATMGEYRSLVVIAIPMTSGGTLIGYTIFPAIKPTIPYRDQELKKMTIHQGAIE